jgi:hypothetical protein
MRTGLIIFGIILLLVGAGLYYVPALGGQSTTTTPSSTSTSYASITVPIIVTYLILIAGAITLILGLLIPDPVRKTIIHEPTSDRVSDIETKEEEDLDGTHKKTVVRQYHARHRV